MALLKTIGPAESKDNLPSEGFGNYLSKTTKVAVANTTIVNRADIVDLAADGGVRFGVNRIMTQSAKKIQDEFGANGEPVYSVTGDTFDQIRFVGDWEDSNTSSGLYIGGGDITDSTSYVEITFYGTGLNLLMLTQVGGTREVDVHIDGVFNNTIDMIGSGTLQSRNYSANSIYSAIPTQSLGLYTVKIQKKNDNGVPHIYGFEILNESTQLDIRPNTAFINGESVSVAQSTTDYNSGFTNEFGTLGAKGGQVIVYSDDQGVIHKDIQWTDVAASTSLLDVDHSNEEVIRTYNFREFGAGRSDDFSTLTTTLTDRVFTLDDGTTTLLGNNIRRNTVVTAHDSVRVENAINNFIVITFVGTGLDLTVVPDADGVPTNLTFEVDGTSYTMDPNFIGGNPYKLSVCSGLSYGTHTVKFTQSATSSNPFGIQDFIIYGPKKPSLPTDSVELGSYYLMADYVANAVVGVETISTGILRKDCSREMIYVGTWSFTSPHLLSVGGSVCGSANNGDVAQYSFFGTGLGIRLDTGNGADVTVDIDGSTNHSALTTSVYGGTLAFTDTTGNISGNAVESSGLEISGLALGLHTITFTINNSITFNIEALDIITPIHSTKQNKPTMQNTLEVGSQAISDSRVYSPIEEVNEDSEPNWVQAKGITSSPTTTSTTGVPLEDMTCSIKTNGGPLELNFNGPIYNSAVSSFTYFYFVVDGEQVLEIFYDQETGTAINHSQVACSGIVPVGAGYHTIQMYWYVGSSSGSSNGLNRFLTVKELK